MIVAHSGAEKAKVCSNAKAKVARAIHRPVLALARADMLTQIGAFPATHLLLMWLAGYRVWFAGGSRLTCRRDFDAGAVLHYALTENGNNACHRPWSLPNKQKRVTSSCIEISTDIGSHGH